MQRWLIVRGTFGIAEPLTRIEDLPPHVPTASRLEARADADAMPDVIPNGMPGADAWFVARPALEHTWTRIGEDVFREGQGEFSMQAVVERRLGDLLRVP